MKRLGSANLGHKRYGLTGSCRQTGSCWHRGLFCWPWRLELIGTISTIRTHLAATFIEFVTGGNRAG